MKVALYTGLALLLSWATLAAIQLTSELLVLLARSAVKALF